MIETTDNVYETWSVVSHSLWLERAGIFPSHRVLLRPQDGARFTRGNGAWFLWNSDAMISGKWYSTRAQAAQAVWRGAGWRDSRDNLIDWGETHDS